MKKDLVKIIPKSKPKTSGPVRISFLILILIALIVAGLFFYLEIKSNSLVEKNEQLKEKIDNLKKKTELEEELLTTSYKIKDFSKLVEEHKEISVFFDFLKNSCHPKLEIKSLKMDLPTRSVVLSGETSSFETAGEQILILKKSGEIENIEASDLTLSRKGRVNIGLRFNFSNNLINK